MVHKEGVYLERMSNTLRNQFWSLLNSYLLAFSPASNFKVNSQEVLLGTLGTNYLKIPASVPINTLQEIRDYLRYYLHSCEWYKAYELIEYIYGNLLHNIYDKKRFAQSLNILLKRNSSIYCFLGECGRFIPIGNITDKEELEEILSSEECPVTVNAHLRKAVEYLANKPIPQLKDSIKETIIIIEEICDLLIDVIPVLNRNLTKEQINGYKEIYHAMEAFVKMNQYIRTTHNINHPLLNKNPVSFEDARYTFVSCTSFSNYIFKRIRELGIKISIVSETSPKTVNM
ncbi:MAG: hypothetical protein PHY28_00245 [Dehalococcoidales bacterium]|nr:hypothetical protein [Dehalococcoidales bacterium]